MWKIKKDLLIDTELPFNNFVTTKNIGNMREDSLRKSFCKARDLDFRSLTTVQQVHGNRIAVVNESNKGMQIPLADGLVTKSNGISLAVFTADCLPVFFWSRDKTVIGMAHAGWKGLAKKILPKMVEIFSQKFGVSSKDVFVSIGPHIQQCCYEVGSEVLKEFNISQKSRKLDLSSIAVKQLMDAGVKNISSSCKCTCHETDLFFSYRKDKTDNRMMSVVNKLK
ncbi:peptidoglycan editing factor PgeF [Elusimicrobiota bacterium]